MSVTLPRLVVAAPSTGQGKTTIATGLMAALRRRGLEVSGHKVGPDYIDPGYHALATGRPGRNLDPHLVGESRVVPLLLNGARGAEVAIIEGVMGLYDGRLGTQGFASTAHVAALTDSPVVLVVDIARMSRSAAAIAAGMAAFDERIAVAGVILNRTGSPRNDAEIVAAVEGAGLAVLGLMPRDPELATPSRHLGLVTAAERDGSVALIDRLGSQVAAHLDLDAVLDVARQAPMLDGAPWDPAEHVTPGSSAGAFGAGERPVVAMAGGRAFTFRYAETEELLTAAGCDVVTFDPLADAALPAGTRGVYLGGGFPEVYAGELAANRPLLDDLRAAVEAGVPTVAECAGLLYLAQSLDGAPMAQVLPATAEMASRLTLRYPVATAVGDSVLTRAGEEVTGHEFHRTVTTPASGDGGAGDGHAAAWVIDDAPSGFAGGTLHASYLHVHWAGHPQLAQRFADAVHAATPHDSPVADHTSPDLVLEPTSTAPTDPPRDPLRHHGDAETGDGLLDFAVNVYDGPRPAWLDQTLRDSLTQIDTYPDATAATAALAAHHGRDVEEVLPTAGAAEAFTLIARLRPWRRPVVIHPQFTEPHAALAQAGHDVTTVLCRAENGFAFDPGDVPDDADLVVLGNPTNPTGVLHRASLITALRRPGRLVVVDEAFLDAVPNEPESLLRERDSSSGDLVVLRSLTKHWSIPGIRAGFVVGDPTVIRDLAAQQTPWSVATPALAAMIACSTPQAAAESRERALTLARWRAVLEGGLHARGLEFVPSSAPFVLVRPGEGAH
ncbi:cobyrinate a,c-diamide synthase, partial [Kribbia dieselivorans]|uniref:cobyrinate a,c-diamide synthase n=1 Tax=Kribbia dieselivorans TaxID=331526 RepID=UPI000839AD40